MENTNTNPLEMEYRSPIADNVQGLKQSLDALDLTSIQAPELEVQVSKLEHPINFLRELCCRTLALDKGIAGLCALLTDMHGELQQGDLRSKSRKKTNQRYLFLLKIMKDMGIEVIGPDCLHSQFDSKIHRIIQIVPPDDEQSEMIVVNVHRFGAKIGEWFVHPAEVTITKHTNLEV